MTTARHAPALRVEVVTQPALQLAVLFLSLLAVSALLLALAAHQACPAWLPGLAWPAAAALAWRSARVRRRLLLWDGQLWRLHACDPAGAPLGAGQEVHLTAVFDFDRWLLLRARPVEPSASLLRRLRHGLVPTYLPLSQRRQASVWPALRATLFAASAAHAASDPARAHDQVP